ncbi:MAG: TatD family hydrolase [Candidatus Melainabacteria bacterium]|nr:TatD family hydrolase [Candidatus Melainabacteria bacterium]
MTNPILIDTHAHINFNEYDSDREEVMERAFNSGVGKILHSCCRVNEVETLLKLSKQFNGNGFSNLYIAIGVHPTEFHSWDDESEDDILAVLDRELVNPENKIRAIGETGLDYYHCTTKAEQEKQREIFNRQIELAKRFQLPLIIHTRDAESDTLSILESHFKNTKSDRNGTIHCFTGSQDFALACIELGFFISWSGILTFKSSKSLREVAKVVPLEKTLVETDCPFLAPQAQRGKRNEPSYVNYVAEQLSEIKDLGKTEIMNITTQNAEYLFKI